MATLVTITCGTCGHAASGRTMAIAAGYLARHICERQLELKARAERVEARKAHEGVRRDCRHKHARHQHGTSTAYKADGCHCRACIDANTAAEKARNKAKAYGRYDSGRVDARPAREHLAFLAQNGVSLKQAAKLAGVAHSTLGHIVHGRKDRGEGPRKRIERRVSEAVLALQPGIEATARGRLVDATGTRRRLQALVAVGYSITRLGTRLRITTSNMAGPMGARSEVTAATARKVRDLYERLWDAPPPESTRGERTAATRARKHAQVQGWAQPMAWDEDTIDDPAAEPSGVAADASINAPAADLAEDVEHMLASNASPEEVAQRTHRTVKGLEGAMARIGRHDLVAWLRTGHQPPDYHRQDSAA